MAQQVKDLALSLLWHGFNPWPRELPHAVGVAKKKKKKKKINTEFPLQLSSNEPN